MQNGLKKVFLTSALLGSLSCVYAEAKVVGSFAFVGMAMDYREYNEAGDIVDSEKSNLSQILGFEMGLGFLLHETRESYSYINFNLLNVAGETDYKGSLHGSTAGYGSYLGTTVNVIADFDVDYMYHTVLSDRFEISYGLGLGYRYWERKLSASQIELYEWFSLRPKVGAAFELTPELRLALDLEYQYGLNPTMSESYYGLDFDFGAADILKVSLPVTYKYSSAMDFFIEGVYERQEIEASNVKSGFYEPDSTANNTYLKLGLVYKY
jgi:hypothetical protein